MKLDDNTPYLGFNEFYTIPFVGIILGSVMNGVGISLNVFNTGLVRERAAIER